MKKNKTLYILLCVAILGIAGYFIWLKWFKKPVVLGPNGEILPTPTEPTPTGGTGGIQTGGGYSWEPPPPIAGMRVCECADFYQMNAETLAGSNIWVSYADGAQVRDGIAICQVNVLFADNFNPVTCNEAPTSASGGGLTG